MKEDLRGTLWRVAAFLLLCFLGIFAIVAVFGQIRFDSHKSYNALFANVSGLREGDFVRIAGVEVGKVKTIQVQRDSTVMVQFGVDSSVVLTNGDRAVVRYQDLVGNRYLAIDAGPGGLKRLNPGSTIPLDRTQPALDVNALIGGFRPLFKALNPDQVNTLSGQLIQVLQGQGDVIDAFLTQTASLTSTLANRDQLIGQVIDNLNTVLGTLSSQSKQMDSAVDSIAQLVQKLADRKQDVSNGLAYINSAAGSLADLLTQAREPLNNTIVQLDRAGGAVASERDYLDGILQSLPEKYRLLARQGIYGDFFSFYLCDMILKVNGKGGQPVYVKIASQTTGRCTPQ